MKGDYNFSTSLMKTDLRKTNAEEEEKKPEQIRDFFFIIKCVYTYFIFLREIARFNCYITSF